MKMMLVLLCLATVFSYPDNSTNSTVISAKPLDSCKCDPIFFDENGIAGDIKAPLLETFCKNVTCKLYIKPKKDHMVSLFVTYRTIIPTAAFIYNDQEEDRILFTKRLGEMQQFDSLVTPVDYGLIIEIQINYTWYYLSPSFEAKFTRVNTSQIKQQCPDPRVNVNFTHQIYKTEYWPTAGCILHMTSDHPIQLHSICKEYTDEMQIVQLTESEEIDTYYVESYDFTKTLPHNATIHGGRSTRYYNRNNYETCQLTIFSLPYDPCKCHDVRHFNKNEDNIYSLTSPGYPEMFCQQLNCYYNFTSDEAPGEGNVTFFYVSTFHQSRARGDILVIRIDGEIVSTLDDSNPNQTDVAIYQGKLVEVTYTATSMLSRQHGFAMNMTTFTMPLKCACPTNKPKALEEKGTYEITFPSYCKMMHCKYEIPNKQLENRIFRMHITYELATEKEYLVLDAGEIAYTVRKDYSARNWTELWDLITDKNVMLKYIRHYSEEESNITESYIKIEWEWLTFSGCSKTCNGGVVQTDPKIPKVIYSPRYPKEYCPHLNCIYNIQAPPGHHIQLNVTEFETEPQADYLFFYDGYNATGNLTLKIAGSLKELPVIKSTGRNFSLLFKTDSSVDKKGFKIFYVAIPDPESPLQTTIGGSIIIFGVFTLLVAITVLIFFAWKSFNKIDIPQHIENPVYGFSAYDDALILVDKDNEE